MFSRTTKSFENKILKIVTEIALKQQDIEKRLIKGFGSRLACVTLTPAFRTFSPASTQKELAPLQRGKFSK